MIIWDKQKTVIQGKSKTVKVMRICVGCNAEEYVDIARARAKGDNLKCAPCGRKSFSFSLGPNRTFKDFR